MQESLTDAARHAAAAAAHVNVACGPAGMVIDISDDGQTGAETTRSSGSHLPGSGLVGMRERGLALGGSLTAGQCKQGGWRVHATLPYPATTP